LLLSYKLGLNCLILCVSMFFVVFLFYCFQKKKKKNRIGGEDAEYIYIYIRVVFQILYVFLPDISVHCALIEYAYV
jgi:uncharacterized membrane protein YhaH (DUF805 family)